MFDVVYFAASVDPPDVNAAFANSLGIEFPLLSDPTKEVAKAYGVVTSGAQYASRWTFYIGADGRILYIDRNVTPATHGKAVAAKLAELGIPRRRPVPRD